MAISFHKYWNYNDQESVKKFVDIRQQYNAPVWLGESGENSNLWYRDAIRLVEQNEIGWAWWPFKKIGFNNPLEVKMPADYQKVLNFWEGKGNKPSSDEAYKGIMDLANNVKLENCIYHKDVIDAMFRETRGNETIPFKKHIAKSGLSIQAVDYDMGRNGFAYFDKDTANYWVANGGKHTSWNQGRTYRNDGVDISKDGDQFYVDHFEPGEWLQFTISSDIQKSFELALSISSKQDGKIILTCNGKNYEANIKANEMWNEIETKKVFFRKGRNVLRIKVQTGELNFKSIRFK
jgi:hypothetical protein